MAKVSVIVPVYNVGKYLEKCLESIISQSFKDIEIICVNDGSTDNSLQILTEYANKDTRIKIISKPNGGLFSARHVGMAAAIGEYLLFVDSDDWIDKTLIEKTIQKISETNSDMVVFGAYSVKGQSVSRGMYSVNKINPKLKERLLSRKDYENDLFQFPPTAWCKLYRRKFVEDNNIKFQEIKDGEDQLFYLKAILTAKNIYIINEDLYYYVKNRAGAITSSYTKKSISPILNFYAAEELLKSLTLTDKYINQVINKYFSKAMSWYCKCDDSLKDDYYKNLQEFKNFIVSNYSNGWWKYIEINKSETYLRIKLKTLVSKIRWKFKKGL